MHASRQITKLPLWPQFFSSKLKSLESLYDKLEIFLVGRNSDKLKQKELTRIQEFIRLTVSKIMLESQARGGKESGEIWSPGQQDIVKNIVMGPLWDSS